MIRKENELLNQMNNITYEDIFNSFDNVVSNGYEQLTHELDTEKHQQIKSETIRQVNYSLNKNKWIKVLLIASMILIFITTFTSPFGQNTLADIINKIYFIPSEGKASIDPSQEIYILSAPIRVDCGGSTMTIHNITKKSGSVSIDITGNRVLDFHSLSISANNEIYQSNHSIIGGGYDYGGNYYFNLPNKLNTFTLTLFGIYKIPVSLTKAIGFEDYKQLGPTDIYNNLGLTLIPLKLKDSIQFELLQHSTNLGTVICYGAYNKEAQSNINITIKDNNGQKYKSDYPASFTGTQSRFSFVPKASPPYTIQIPEVTLQYKVHEKIKFSMPKEGSTTINQTVDLHGYKIDITKAIRKKDLVTIYVNTHYNSNNPENVGYFYLDMGKMKLDYYHYILNDQLTTEAFEFHVNPHKKNLTLYFSDLFTLMKGPWTFRLTEKELN